MPNTTDHLHIDGHEFDDEDSALAGDGQYAPFRIFDDRAQDYLPGLYATREDAEAALALIA